MSCSRLVEPSVPSAADICGGQHEKGLLWSYSLFEPLLLSGPFVIDEEGPEDLVSLGCPSCWPPPLSEIHLIAVVQVSFHPPRG